MVIQRTPVIKVRISINAEKSPYPSFFFLRTFFVRINRKRLIVRTTVKRNKSREKIKVTIPERKSLMSWSRIPRFEKKRTSLTSLVLRITKVIKVPPSTRATKNIAPKNANIFESGVFCAFFASAESAGFGFIQILSPLLLGAVFAQMMYSLPLKFMFPFHS